MLVHGNPEELPKPWSRVERCPVAFAPRELHPDLNVAGIAIGRRSDYQRSYDEVVFLAWKQSRQNTGLPGVGLKGTSVC